jgi:hypothetical protein
VTTDYPQKTIFFVVVTRGRVNFILRSDLFRILKGRGWRLVIISPFMGQSAFQEEFGGPNVFFEPLKRMGRWAKRLSYIRSAAMEAEHSTLKEALRIHDLVTFRFRRPPSLRTRLSSVFIRLCVMFLPSPLRRSQKWWEFVVGSAIRRSTAKEYFKKYNPDVVVLGSAGAEGEDVPYIIAGNHYDVPTIAVDSNIDAATYRYFSAPWQVRYWALFGEPQKKEFADLHHIPEESMVTTGALRYDRYFKGITVLPRDVFCKKIGVDPRKRIVTLSPRSPMVFPHNQEIITMILEAIRGGAYGNVELFVRFDPGHPLSVYDEIFLKSFHFERAEDAPDEEHIANLLAHSDVFLGLGATTLAIEACAVGTPAAWIGFDGKTVFGDPTDYSRLQYDVSVFQRLIKSGGIPLLENKEQLLRQIDIFLRDVDTNKDKRLAMLRGEYANAEDGKAGERIVEFIDRILTQHE